MDKKESSRELQNRKAIEALQRGQEEIKAMLANLKPTTDAIRETQIELDPITRDTNLESHKVKHKVDAFPSNMKGFTELTDHHYEKINGVVAEFRIIIAELRVERKYEQENRKETDEKLEILESYMQELKDIGTTTLWREIVSEKELNKQFRNRFIWGWWLILALGALAAVIKGIIEAVKALGNVSK